MRADKPRILCTRSLDACLVEQAAGKGIIIDTLSFIATEATMDEATVSLIVRVSSEPIVAVFTSMNAVEAVGKAVGQEEAGAGGTSGRAVAWKVFCIGSATRKGVIKNFGEGSIGGTAESAGALAGVILGHLAADDGEPELDRGEVFFFCGDQRRDELPEKLRQAGVRVNETVVYRTIQTPRKVGPLYDAIIFFSPSAVISYFADNTPPAQTVLFAIGDTTAEAIRSYSGNKLIVSGSPDKEALVRQAIDYFSSPDR